MQLEFKTSCCRPQQQVRGRPSNSNTHAHDYVIVHAHTKEEKKEEKQNNTLLNKRAVSTVRRPMRERGCANVLTAVGICQELFLCLSTHPSLYIRHSPQRNVQQQMPFFFGCVASARNERRRRRRSGRLLTFPFFFLSFLFTPGEI